MSEDYPFDLGAYQRPITTTSSDAQLWFNRGLQWAYSFNQEEAVRCFTKATEFDVNCPMAYWGIAYTRGPNYNKAWIRYDRLDLEKTVKEMRVILKRAQELAASSTYATPVEKAMIEGLAGRYPQTDTIPDDLSSLDKAFAEAMRPVYESFSDDLDVAALFVEALMCLTPRGLWDLNTGEPCGPHTVEAQKVLERAMALPGGHDQPAFGHLYIHLMEMSPFPERALPASYRLGSLVPDGSHMLHMPSHIYVACGDYQRAVDCSNEAIRVDDKYFAITINPSTLYIAYRTHNIKAKVYSAIMAGRFQDALSAVHHLWEIITPEVLSITSPPMADWVESYLGSIAHVLVRFGRWDDILALALPQDQQLFCSATAMIRYARAIAYAVLGQIPEALAEQERFEAARSLVPESRISSLPEHEVNVLCVASTMLRGEIQYRQGNFDAAFRSLREATELEDNLRYSDPPAWMQPSRHALGALLLEQGRVSEAQSVYEEDLGMSLDFPRRKARLNNVWGLQGLYECLVRQGAHDKAQYIRVQRDIALICADVPIQASCFCRLSLGEGQVNPTIATNPSPSPCPCPNSSSGRCLEGKKTCCDLSNGSVVH